MFERRKIFFIKKKLQLRYVLLVFFAMIVTALISVGGAYYLIWQTIAAELAVPEIIAETLLPALTKVNIMLLIFLPSAFIVMILLSILVSHRIAGPIYRVEKDLDEIVKGDYSRRIKFRAGDDLQELAEKINKLLDHFIPSEGPVHGQDSFKANARGLKSRTIFFIRKFKTFLTGSAGVK